MSTETREPINKIWLPARTIRAQDETSAWFWPPNLSRVLKRWAEQLRVRKVHGEGSSSGEGTKSYRFLLFVLLSETGFLWRPGCLRTHPVDQAGLELNLPLLPKGWIKGHDHPAKGKLYTQWYLIFRQTLRKKFPRENLFFLLFLIRPNTIYIQFYI